MYESDGIWGIAIFLLILFAAWGGWGGNRNAYAGPLPATSGCGCGFSNCNTDRDVLKLETTMTAQNALNTCMIIRVLLPCCGLQEVPHQLQTQLQVPQRSLPEFWRIRLRSPRLRYHESPL